MKIFAKKQILSNFLVLSIFLYLLLLLGCAPQYRIKHAKENAWYDMMHMNVSNSKQLSYYTTFFLHDYLLEESYKKDPLQTLINFDRSICENLERDNLFSMAELCFSLAKVQKKDFKLQIKLYLTSSRYAYAYLFEEIGNSLPEQHDPRYRLACDFYNRSLSKCISIMIEHNIRLDNIERKLALLNGYVYISKAESDRLFNIQDYELLLDSYNYEIKGIDFVHRKYGLGAPLIALKSVSTKEISFGMEKRYKENIQLSYPATAILRYQDSICVHTQGKTENAIGELYDPTRYDFVSIKEQKIPLESDFTTPLAYEISQFKMYSGIMAMFRVQDYEKRLGLYLLQPYDKNKIPVVFIHGLMSQPYTWVPMINSLLSDTALHKKYQFWFYGYSTGNPIMINANHLRQTLLEARSRLDPKGDDANFDRMVLVGHSMGGLLAKLMVQSNPKDLWYQLSKTDQPIDKLDISDDYKTYLHQQYEYEPLPFVSRVVFMATPHSGALMADNFLGRLGISLISLPNNTTNMIKNTLTALGNKNIRKSDFKMTSINSLSPANPVLLKIADIPISENVKIHSIIGNDKEANVLGGTDGFVSYNSSHLDNVESELIIHNNHSVHTNPYGIREVRRILLKHLEEIKNQK